MLLSVFSGICQIFPAVLRTERLSRRSLNAARKSYSSVEIIRPSALRAIISSAWAIASSSSAAISLDFLNFAD